MDRHLIAYILLALLFVSLVLLGLHLRHNSREQRIRRDARRSRSFK